MSMAAPPKPHSWYHDGDVDRPAYGRTQPRGRLCQHCRFREEMVKDMPCLGTPHLYQAAHHEGFIEGEKTERQRVRRVLGL